MVVPCRYHTLHDITGPAEHEPMSHPRRRTRHAFKPRYPQPGTPPGTYDTPHVRESGDASVSEIEFDERSLERRDRLSDRPPADSGRVRWVRARAHPSLDLMQRLHHLYDVDPMALEDVVEHGQRPKFSEFGSGDFLSVAVPVSNSSEYSPLAMYVTGNTLITFSDDEAVFAPIEQRLTGTGRLRRSSARYLAYTLLDLAVDTLFPLHDQISDRLEDLEAELFGDPGPGFLTKAHALRRELVVLRRICWATRDVLSDTLRHWDEEAGLRPYLQDSYEHVVAVIDLVETQRDVATSLVEVYLSLASNRLNDVMKVLTIIATLFIPPTFLVGVYGMNFDRRAGPYSMPELGWSFGYLGVWGIIVLMFIGMLIYFRRKGWF